MAHLACVAASGAAADLGWPFFASLGLASLHLARQIHDVDLDSPSDCMAKFVSNGWYGGIIFAAILGDRLLQSPI